MEFTRTKFPKKSHTFRSPKHMEEAQFKRIPKRANDPLIDFWNSLDGLPKHVNTNTKTYKNISILLKEIKTKGFASKKLDSDWLERNGIQQRFIDIPWTIFDIKSAMQILSNMVQGGKWPGPKSFLSKVPLEKIIYNLHGGTSWLLYARNKGKAVPWHEEIQGRTATEEEKAFLQSLDNVLGALPMAIVRSMLKKYNILYQERAITRHLCPNVNAFGRILRDWIQEINMPKIYLSIITPPDGWLWKRFVKEMFADS